MLRAAAAEQLTGRPAAWVVNSHWHADHVYGNQVFADATIIATAQTRATLAQRGDGVVRSLRTQPDLLQAMAAAAAAEGEEARHREALAELADHQAPATTRAYLADMQWRARAFRAAGGTPEQAGALPVPPEYAGWGAPRVFGLNMCELCGRG